MWSFIKVINHRHCVVCTKNICHMGGTSNITMKKSKRCRLFIGMWWKWTIWCFANKIYIVKWASFYLRNNEGNNCFRYGKLECPNITYYKRILYSLDWVLLSITTWACSFNVNNVQNVESILCSSAVNHLSWIQVLKFTISKKFFSYTGILLG